VAHTQASRKQSGAWYTPPELIDIVVEHVVADLGNPSGTHVHVLDPACGDGRFLTAVIERLESVGATVRATGCDIDPNALAKIDHERIRCIEADALMYDWADARFDVVIGNPPFLSQMAASTSRGGSSRHGGGPYADAAAEFLALATRLADPDGGRIGLVLPQSILAARDAGPVRTLVGEHADIAWSWWRRNQRHFDANIHVCAVGLRRPSTRRTWEAEWTRIVADRLGIPHLESAELGTIGSISDRADLNANFRDEYYALVPAVSDDATGPPLVTSGLIDPGVCHWGRRGVRFAKQDFKHPRVDLSRLTGRFPAWAERKLVPKVLIANQTRIIEAVADPEGEWLPGVPVTTATPTGDTSVWEIAAVLTSPIASVISWQTGGGSGLSTTSVRIGPALVGSIPWPDGSLADATEALQNGRIIDCACAVMSAYGLEGDEFDALLAWWSGLLPG
jgi:SAM-dependent methyltransferase